MDLNRNQRNSLRVLWGLILLLVAVTALLLLSRETGPGVRLADALCAAAFAYGVGYLMRATEAER